MRILTLLLPVVLAGCASTYDRPVLKDVDPGTIYVSPSTRLACPLLPRPPDRDMDEEEVGLFLLSWLELYQACSDAKTLLLDAIDSVNGRNENRK